MSLVRLGDYQEMADVCRALKLSQIECDLRPDLDSAQLTHLMKREHTLEAYDTMQINVKYNEERKRDSARLQIYQRLLSLAQEQLSEIRKVQAKQRLEERKQREAIKKQTQRNVQHIIHTLVDDAIWNMPAMRIPREARIARLQKEREHEEWLATCRMQKAEQLKLLWHFNRYESTKVRSLSDKELEKRREWNRRERAKAKLDRQHARELHEQFEEQRRKATRRKEEYDAFKREQEARRILEAEEALVKEQIRVAQSKAPMPPRPNVRAPSIASSLPTAAVEIPRPTRHCQLRAYERKIDLDSDETKHAYKHGMRELCSNGSTKITLGNLKMWRHADGRRTGTVARKGMK